MSLLPTQIPPQTTAFCTANPQGQLIVDINWYLFLYNLWKNVLNSPTGSVATAPAVLVPIADIDVFSADNLQTPRLALNAALLQPDPDVGPSLRDLANALILASDNLLPDPIPAARPTVSVTVGASPFTYTALAQGYLSVTGGTVTSVSITRQGVTVLVGMLTGLFPASRLDQIQITYTVVPTAVFLPN